MPFDSKYKKWRWMMDYCKQENIPPGQTWAWEKAEKEYNTKKYKHFKGGIYTVICEGKLEIDPDNPAYQMIVYKDEEENIWIRPKAEFYGYKNGERRFAPIEEKSKPIVCNHPPLCSNCGTFHRWDKPCRGGITSESLQNIRHSKKRE